MTVIVDRVLYTVGNWRVTGDIENGYVKLWVSKTWGEDWKRVGKGYIIPCWWLFRRSIRTVMTKAIDRVNRLHRKDQEISFGKNIVTEALDNIELEAEALKLLDQEFAS